MSEKKCQQCGHINEGTNKFCVNCGTKFRLPKFCYECGTSFESEEDDSCLICGTKRGEHRMPPAPMPFSDFPVVDPADMANTPKGKIQPRDKSLVLLAGYCTETCATIGGNGYTDWHLNRCTDGSLQIDYYRNYQGYSEEVHEIYPVPADTWDKINQLAEKGCLRKPPEIPVPGMCGGRISLLISDGDKIINIPAYSPFTKEGKKAYSEIVSILQSFK